MPAETWPRGRVALVFPGQGAQEVGMAQDLYESFPTVRALFDRADEVLGFSLSRLCFEGPEEMLRQTINAQPAIFTASLACLEAARARRLFGDHRAPAFVAGHSLGEYTALVASGALDFEEALRLVRERGRLTQEAAQQAPGGMAAIMGLEEAQVRQLCAATGTEIANLNSPLQVVISGTAEALSRAMAQAKAQGARHVVALNISGAFHSSLMQPVAARLKRAIAAAPLRDAQVSIIANVTAQPLQHADELRQELSQQLCRPVAWHQSVSFMVAQGVTTFVEVGPGKVLTALIRRIYPQASLVNWNAVTTITDPLPERKSLEQP